MNPHQRFEGSRGTVSVQRGDQLVLLDVVQSRFYALNELASDIWRMALDGHDMAQIVEEIVGNWDVSHEQVEADASALLERMVSRGLLTPIPSPHADGSVH